mmetsp:Transcript_40526/g.59702  ORF Transcript_40526/g.59702 Transcript_40526/m.59702 type:complete len:96 (+) Transcript_40526:731-1018(+)
MGRLPARGRLSELVLLGGEGRGLAVWRWGGRERRDGVGAFFDFTEGLDEGCAQEGPLRGNRGPLSWFEWQFLNQGQFSCLMRSLFRIKKSQMKRC